MFALNRRAFAAVLMLGAVGLASPVMAEDAHPYFGADAVNLLELLVPPPAQDSAVTKAELAEVKALQAEVTDARKQQAIADHEEGFAAFTATTSAAVDPAKVPLTVALVQRILDTEEEVTGPAKKGFGRPRPPVADEGVKALVKLSKSNSYPSGHTTNGTAIAIVLSAMVPEKRAELMARAEDYATSRMIVGMHYRSDLAAGYAAGALMAQKLMETEEFKKDFAPAKAELRAALGL